jgi:RNA polymerase sigma factor (TIGR02999 family)
MSDVTRILTQIQSGAATSDELLPVVYDELRKLAASRLSQENLAQTLSATSLVHEAYLRLVGSQPVQWDSRGHFFAAAAEAMRRILINRARDRSRQKRGGESRRLDLDQIEVAFDTHDDDLLAVDEALAQLALHDAQAAELVKLRFFAGLNQREAAAALGLPPRTADRTWAYARAWLFDRLGGAK